MNFLKNLTIRKKLFFTTIALVLVLSIIKLYEFSILDSFNASIVNSVQKRSGAVESVQALESSFLIVTVSLSNYAVSEDRKWLNILNESRLKFKDAINTLLAEYKDEQIAQPLQRVDVSARNFFSGIDRISKNSSQTASFLRNNSSKIQDLILEIDNLSQYFIKSSEAGNLFVSQTMKSIRIISYSSTLIIIVIIFVLVFTQLGVIIKPVSDLVNGVKLIWAGDTDHRINITTSDEIGELAKVFNLMAESIHREKTRLFEKANTDEMTGIYNFRYFQDSIEREFAKASRFNHQLSFIIMDVDFFKVYNDTNGHQAGDQVLKTVANVVRNSCRDIDIPARYGGEEFVVILPDTNLSSALKVAERIRKSVEAEVIEHQEKQPNKNLTISLGVANYPENASTPAELVENADTALYEAKTTGKNKVCFSVVKK